MARITGVSREDLIRQSYKVATTQIHELIKKEIAKINEVAEKAKPSLFQKYLGAVTLPWAAFQGIMEGIPDFLLSIGLTANQLLNNFSQIGGDDWVGDLTYALADIPISIVQGYLGAYTSIAGGATKLLGMDGATEALVGENGLMKGIIEGSNNIRGSINNPRNLLPSALGGNVSTNSGYDFMRSYNQMQDEAKKVNDEKYADVDLGWFTSSRDWYQQNITSHMTHFSDEAFGDQEWYGEKVKPVLNSFGRIIPSVILAYSGKALKLSPQVTSALSKAYFAGSVGAASMDEAIKSGSSVQEAYQYAYTNAIMEMSLESLMPEGFNFKNVKFKTFTEVLESIAGESIEEGLAELSGQGMSHYLGKIEDEVSRKDLFKDVIFSSIVGGIGGGLFGGTNIAFSNQAKGTLDYKASEVGKAIFEDVSERGEKVVADDARIALKNFNDALNSQEYTQEQKDEFFKDNEFFGQLISKVTTNKDGVDVVSYEFTDKGKRILDGKIMSRQGDMVISTDTHAVGSKNVMVDYVDNIDGAKIDILTNEQVNELPQERQQEIEFAKENNLNVVFVKPRQALAPLAVQPKAFNAYQKDGVFYINVDAPLSFNNYIAHEANDKIGQLFRQGKLSQSESEGYIEFVKMFDIKNPAYKSILEEHNVTFDEKAYREMYKGRPDIEELIQNEVLSAVIEQTFSGTEVLESVYEKNPTMIQNVGNIFKNHLTTIKNLMGFTKTMGTNDYLKTMQSAFSNVLRDSRVVIEGANNIASGLYFNSSNSKGTFSLKPLIEFDLGDENLIDKVVGFAESMKGVDYKPVTDPKLQKLGYFMEIEGFIFNKDKFGTHPNEGISRLQYIPTDNVFYVDIESKSRKTNNFIFEKTIMPDIQTSKGIIKNPLMSTIGLNPSASIYFAHRGFLPSQSINIETASGNSFPGNEFFSGIKSRVLGGVNGVGQKGFKFGVVLKSSFLDNPENTIIGRVDLFSFTRQFLSPFQSDGTLQDVSQDKIFTSTNTVKMMNNEVVRFDLGRVDSTDQEGSADAIHALDLLVNEEINKYRFENNSFPDKDWIEDVRQDFINQGIVEIDFSEWNSQSVFNKPSQGKFVNYYKNKLWNRKMNATDDVDLFQKNLLVAQYSFDREFKHISSKILAENYLRRYVNNEDFDLGTNDTTLALALRQVGLAVDVAGETRIKNKQDIKKYLDNIDKTKDIEIVELYGRAIHSLAKLMARPQFFDTQTKIIEEVRTATESHPFIREINDIRAYLEYSGFEDRIVEAKGKVTLDDVAVFMFKKYGFEQSGIETPLEQVNNDNEATITEEQRAQNQKDFAPPFNTNIKATELYSMLYNLANEKGIKIYEEEHPNQVIALDKTTVSKSNLTKTLVNENIADDSMYSLSTRDGNSVNHIDVHTLVERMKARHKEVFAKAKQGGIFVSYKNGVIVDNTGEVYSEKMLNLIEYISTTPNHKLDLDDLRKQPAYLDFVQKSEDSVFEFMEMYPNLLPETQYINTKQRIELREEIKNKEIERVKSNPNYLKNKKVSFVIGHPAAGKSSRLADYVGIFNSAYIADSDMIKERLVSDHDFSYNGFNASVVHTEAKYINQDIIKTLTKEGYNIVLPIVGSARNRVMRYIDEFKLDGYTDFELYLNEVERYTAIKRGVARTLNQRRFIPIDVFEGGDANGTYELIKKEDVFNGKYYKQSNEVGLNETPKRLESNIGPEFDRYIGEQFEKLARDIERRSASLQAEIDFQADAYRYDATSGRYGRLLKPWFLDNELFSLNNKNGTTVNHIDPTQFVKGHEQADAISQMEEMENEASLTSRTKFKFNERKKGQFETLRKQAQTSSQHEYEGNEQRYADMQEDLSKKLNKSKNTMGKALNQMRIAWQASLNKETHSKKIANHMGSTTAKVLMMELHKLNQIIEKDTTRTEKMPTQQELIALAETVNRAIYASLDYMDKELLVAINVNDTNPNGYLYTRAIYWYLRDIAKTEVWNEDVEVSFNKDNRGRSYRRLMNAIIGFNKKGGVRELQNAMGQFERATSVEPITDLLPKGPGTVETTKKFWDKNTQMINNINAHTEFKNKINPFIDPFTVSEVQGLFDSNSWSMILMDKILRGSDRQLRIKRVFNAIFENGDWLKNNYKNLIELEKPENGVEIAQLGGLKVRKSQVMYLRNMMLREIARNVAIDMGLIKGIKTHHFESGFEIDILSESTIRQEKQDNKVVAKIQDSQKLLEELDNIIENDAFAKDYNNKVMEMFETMFPYVNERYKEINGTNLRQDGKEIQKQLRLLTEQEQKKFFDKLPKSSNMDNISYLYVPFLMDNSGYFKQDKVSFKEIMDLGVFDGMTQELTDTTARASVDSITNVMYGYEQEVANYYGLHRIMRDLNLILNDALEGYDQTTYINRNISKEAISFYQELLKDMANYKPTDKKLLVRMGGQTMDINKVLSWTRRNFYKASLGLNVKVMVTQFTTMLSFANIYGHGATFLPNMMKNLYAQASKENRKVIKEMTDENNFYWDRARMATFELGEATKQGIGGNSPFEKFTEFLMAGVGFTDSMINKAFYLTLLETTNPQTQQKFTPQEASETLKVAILRSQSSALDVTKSNILRTNNEILKMFMKFTGEPLKLITQVYSSQKNIQLIKKLKASKDAIMREQEAKVVKEREEFQKRAEELEIAEAKENDPDFASMETKEQKQIRKEIKEAKSRKFAQARKFKDTQEMAVNTNKLIDQTIASEPQVRELATRRKMAYVVAIMYMSSLTSAFWLVRTKGGKTEKPEDEEIWAFIAKKLGANFIDEIIGMYPLIRDVYQVVGKGFDMDAIDELGSFNDLMKTTYYFMNAVASGNEIQWGRTTRTMLASASKTLGLPFHSLERLFTTPLLYIDEPTYYKYKMLTGARDRSNIQLKEAIEKNDTRMINAIINNKIAKRDVKLSKVVASELVRLASTNNEVTFTGINDEYTVDGIKYELTKAQKRKFAEIYNQADFVIQKMITSPQYKRLTDAKKKSLIQSIYSYYLRKAKQDVLKVEVIPKGSYHATLSRAYLYFVGISERLYREQLKEKKKRV